MIDYGFWQQERARVLNLKEVHPEIGNYLTAIDVILEQQPKGDGASREALVERAMAKLTINLSPHERALVMGGIRIGMDEK